MQNKRRSKNAEGDLVRKLHFEHQMITNREVSRAASETIIPFCLKHNLKMIIADNDKKLHCKEMVDMCEAAGITVYIGAGKNCGDNLNGYPPRSHDAQPIETVFANVFQAAQLDLQRREKNNNRVRTMRMWKNALDKTWKEYPLEEIRKVIDRQPMIMQAIVDAQGERTRF